MYYKTTHMTGCPNGLLVNIEEEYSKKPRSGQILISESFLKQVFEKYQMTNHIGHAIWHIENPDSPFPCGTCEHLRVEEH